MYPFKVQTLLASRMIVFTQKRIISGKYFKTISRSRFWHDPTCKPLKRKKHITVVNCGTVVNKIFRFTNVINFY